MAWRSTRRFSTTAPWNLISAQTPTMRSPALKDSSEEGSSRSIPSGRSTHVVAHDQNTTRLMATPPSFRSQTVNPKPPFGSFLIRPSKTHSPYLSASLRAALALIITS